MLGLNPVLHYSITPICFARLVLQTGDFPPVAIEVADEKGMPVRDFFNLFNFGDTELSASFSELPVTFRERRRRCHRDGVTLEATQILSILFGNLKAGDIPRGRRILDVVGPGSGYMSDDVEP